MILNFFRLNEENSPFSLDEINFLTKQVLISKGIIISNSVAEEIFNNFSAIFKYKKSIFK